MKKRHIAIIVLLLLILTISLTFLVSNKRKVIVEIDSTKLTLDDFIYDIYLLEFERKIWNEKYKESLGIDYWDYEFEDMTMEQLAKDSIMTRVILNEILSDQAKKEGYTLNNEELATVEKNVNKLLASMSEVELKKTGLNRGILTNSFNKLAHADKYYLALTADYEVDEASIKNTISPNEYREYITECLFIPTAEFRDQQITPYQEDDLKKVHKSMLEIRDLILNGYNFDEVMGHFNGLTRYERSFILSDKNAEEEYKEAARKLNNDEYSDVITTSFGHYIIHMLDNNSSERYKKAIQDAIQDEKDAQFRMHYDILLKDYDITINSEYWDTLDLDSLLQD